MSDFGVLYTRTPKRSYARQWTPYLNLPYVENTFIDVPQQQVQKPFDPNEIVENGDVTNYFAAAPKIIKICVSGVVTLGNGEKVIVEPLNWVLYSETSQVPIDVVTETVFNNSYTDKFELCPACLAKSQALRAGGKIPTFDDLIKTLENGNCLTLQDGVVIRTFEDLQNWASKSGVKIG